jgi:hypothetical protein
MLLRSLAAVFLAVHGLIHLIGFVVPFRLATFKAYPFTTTAFWGHVQLGDRGAKLVGLLWLIGAVAFLSASVAVVAKVPWALTVALFGAVFSLALCILGSPAALFGVVANLAILGAVAAVIAFWFTLFAGM